MGEKVGGAEEGRPKGGYGGGDMEDFLRSELMKRGCGLCGMAVVAAMAFGGVLMGQTVPTTVPARKREWGDAGDGCGVWAGGRGEVVVGCVGACGRGAIWGGGDGAWGRMERRG